MKLLLDRHPILVALTGSNGAGKTTFYNVHLKPSGLRFLNPDLLSQALGLQPQDAAQAMTALRRELVKQRESFVFETVFSDPVGDKLSFLKEAEKSGYTVVLCFIGLAGPATSEQRVAMRVSQGGHAVPPEKLIARFPRTMANLKAAIRDLSHVFIFDNEDLQTPFCKVAVFDRGKPLYFSRTAPKWLTAFLPKPLKP